MQGKSAEEEEEEEEKDEDGEEEEGEKRLRRQLLITNQICIPSHFSIRSLSLDASRAGRPLRLRRRPHPHRG